MFVHDVQADSSSYDPWDYDVDGDGVLSMGEFVNILFHEGFHENLMSPGEVFHGTDILEDGAVDSEELEWFLEEADSWALELAEART